MKGSMELAADQDLEEWHALLDRFFKILTDGVHRFEGTVNQYTGDGIMALFGAPIAHEDHAQRACYARSTTRSTSPMRVASAASITSPVSISLSPIDRPTSAIRRGRPPQAGVIPIVTCLNAKRAPLLAIRICAGERHLASAAEAVAIDGGYYGTGRRLRRSINPCI